MSVAQGQSSVGSASCVDVLSLEAEGAVWAKTAVDADGPSVAVSVGKSV